MVNAVLFNSKFYSSPWRNILCIFIDEQIITADYHDSNSESGNKVKKNCMNSRSFWRYSIERWPNNSQIQDKTIWKYHKNPEFNAFELPSVTTRLPYERRNNTTFLLNTIQNSAILCKKIKSLPSIYKKLIIRIYEDSLMFPPNNFTRLFLSKKKNQYY